MKEQNITVALRVRPINPREVRSGARPIARVVDKNLVVLMDPNRDSDDILRAKRCHDHSYMFDVAFSRRATQRDVYQQTAQGLVSKVISGYNATVFAYGPTGAGKTYTMLGRTGEPGIMALTLSDLFTKMEENKATSRYRVTMAYLEIYNEMVRNLLGGQSAGILDLREDSRGATVVSGLTEVEVHDPEQVMALLTRGNLRRTCEPTAANKTSSRSHAILKVTVEQQSRVLNMCQKIRTGVLFMIDLAGSERAANTQNRGLRMKEGAHINRSLLALANCINTLSSGGQYVNYRDSKLTRLLKDALSGNCYTVMIAHISPASTCYEESKNTLKYADRVKHLKTKVSSNVVEVDTHVSEYQACMDSMRTRITELERQLEWREGEGEGLVSELRTLLKEEKKIREEMVSLEHRLLLNALERQKHTATIRLVGGASTPSPLPPSSLSPLPTTLEDTGQASLLFQRSFNWIAEPSHMIEPSLSMDDITALPDDHMTTMETKQSDHVTTTAEKSISPPSDHMTTVESSHDNHMTTEEEEEVQHARTELPRLQMDRRRIEARHRRLGRKLMETCTNKSQLQKSVSGSGRLHPHQVELCAALQLCGELEEEGRQRELAGAQGSLQLGRREATLEGLLELNHQLIAALHQYKMLLEKVELRGQDRLPPLEPLLSRSSRLTWHAERERRLPVAGRALQLPTFSALSARLASATMTGSKSNLFVEDVTDGEEEEEEVGGASITATSDLSPSSLPQDTLHLFSSPSLPPLPVTTSLTSPSTTHTPHSILFPNPSLPATLPHFPLTHCQLCSQSTSPPPPPPTHHLVPLRFRAPSKRGSFKLRSTKRASIPHQCGTDNVVQSGKRTSILSKVAVNSPRLPVSSSSVNKTKSVASDYNPLASLSEDSHHHDTTITGKTTDTAATGNGGKKNTDTVALSNGGKRNTDTAATGNGGKRNSDTVALSNGSVIDKESEKMVEGTSHQSTELQQSSSSTHPGPSTQPINTAITEPSTAGKSGPSTTDTSSAETTAQQPTTAPEVSTVAATDAPPDTRTEGKRGEPQFQSESQVSLTLSSTRGKTKSRAGGRGGVKNLLRGKQASTIPVVKATEHRKTRQQSTVFPKRRQKRERQTLVPSKVVAGTPYLSTTATSKSEAKKIVFKRTNPSHQVPKFKSPYHVPMAKTKKTKK